MEALQKPAQSLACLMAETPGDAENSSKVQKLELPQNGGDAEPQVQNTHEPKSTKQQNKKKTNKSKAVVGLNFVTCVHHDKKKLFFCELCSVRGQLDHMTSLTHRKAYVEHKYPGWTANETNMEKLYKRVLRLAAVKRSNGIGMKKLNVTAKVFTALRTAPLTEALNQLKLLQTKPEDGTDLKTTPSQPETSTFIDHEHGIQSNSVDHSSPPPPPLLCSTISSTLLSPYFIRIPPPLSSQTESPTQCLFVPNPLYEPISPPSAADCPDITNVASPNSYSAPPVYKLISPPSAADFPDITNVAYPNSYSAPPVYKLISPPSASDCPDITNVAPPNSYSAPPVNKLVSPPPASDSKHLTIAAPPNLSTLPTPVRLTHHIECEKPSACRQSILSKLLRDAVPSEAYCFPNLPTVLGQSHASVFLNVMGHSDTDPIIGLSNVLECRGISQPTFFLCVNCAEKVSIKNFCDHMTSEQHQHLSIRTQYPEIFQQWQCQPILQMTIRDLAEKLALAEKGFDAKVIKLNQNQYESLCSTDFHDAVEILQRMFGPCLDKSSQPSHLAGQNQRKTFTVRSPPESLEAEKDHQSQQSCENTTQIKKIHKETPVSATVGLQERSHTHTFPCPTTIQQKTGYNEENSFKHTGLNYANKKRSEADAVVGLSAVIECRSEGQASLYLCVSCSSKHNHNLINPHLVKPGHRYSYMKRRYPSLFEDWSDSVSRPERSMRLMRFAHKVEMNNEDEPGQLQVMKLKCDDLKEIKAMSYDKAIIYLQKIRKEQNLCALKTCISPKITKNLIKLERMEKVVTTQYSPTLPGMSSQEPKRACKRRAVEQDLPHHSFPAKEQCSDVPSTHMLQSPAIGSNQKSSGSPVKRIKISGIDSDGVTQLQKESSRRSPRSLDPSSQTFKRITSMDETVLKNNEKQKNASSIIAPQQRDSCPSTSSISALSSMKVQEIARLSEKRMVKQGLSENAWNYENRQFRPETPSETSTNPGADSSTNTVAMEQQCTYSHNYNQVHDPHYNWNVPDKNLKPSLTHNDHANLHLSMVSGYGTATSATSQVTPEYAVSHQYLVYQHPDYPSVTAVSNTVAPDYLVPVNERAMNYEVAVPGISTNGTYPMNTDSAQTLLMVHQPQQVYQPIQLFQDPKTLHTCCACYAYNQARQTNQTVTDENVTLKPAFEHGVYPLASWPHKQDFKRTEETTK